MKKGFDRAALTAGLAGGAVCAAKKLRGGGEDGVVSGYGQTALVTGASGGLGKAYAEEFAKHGFDLVLVARSREKLEAAAKELRDRYNVKVTAVDEDLSDPQGGQRLYDKVKALGIQVDQLVNNAGAGKMSRVIDADVKSMTDLINLNCTATAVLCRLFGADMAARHSGRILNMASLGAVMPDPYFNVYGPSKAFDYYLTEAMYGEMQGSGVTVTTVCSGPIKTNWSKNAGKADSGMAKDPAVIAREGFDGMQKGRLVVIATPLYRAEAALAHAMPDALVARVIRKWQAGLIEKSGR
jgi:short-subunit dehydrogenase